ncbi:hypothetical protein ACVOMV_29360 [Mesorhizobium atlanticum]
MRPMVADVCRASLVLISSGVERPLPQMGNQTIGQRIGGWRFFVSEATNCTTIENAAFEIDMARSVGRSDAAPQIAAERVPVYRATRIKRATWRPVRRSLGCPFQTGACAKQREAMLRPHHV